MRPRLQRARLSAQLALDRRPPRLVFIVVFRREAALIDFRNRRRFSEQTNVGVCFADVGSLDFFVYRLAFCLTYAQNLQDVPCLAAA